MQEFTISLITATKDEYNSIKSKLKGLLYEYFEYKPYSNKIPFPYFTGFLQKIEELKDIKVFLICIYSGFGKLNAVSSATALLERYNVNLLINFGACGALINKLKIGDIVLPKLIFESSYVSMNNVEFNPDKGKTSVGINKLENKIHKEIKKKLNEIKEVVGCSSEMDIDSSRKKEFLRKYYNADICDWESFSIRKLAHIWKIPSLIIRVVSDYANENFLIDYKKNIENVLDKGSNVLLDEILSISCKICISDLIF